MHEATATTSMVIEEKTIPPLLNAFGKNMIPVPTNALIKVKKVFTVPASPFLTAREDFRVPSSGRLSPALSGCPSSSSSSSSSSESPRSSPAKFPYRSRNSMKFLVPGTVVTLDARPIFRRMCSRRKPPGCVWSEAVGSSPGSDEVRSGCEKVAARCPNRPLALILNRSR